jgi:hypothetical protein
MGLDIAIRNNTEAGSYDALLDDRVVGVIEYERVGDRMVFRHTVVGLQDHPRLGPEQV